MSDSFIGQVKITAANQIPSGWFPCDGRLLSMSQYDVLFSVLGNTYGGDGQTNFALPDLRDHFVVGAGSSYPVGPQPSATLATVAVDLDPSSIPAGASITPNSSTVTVNASSQDLFLVKGSSINLSAASGILLGPLSSSNSAVATINGTTVTALVAGTATISSNAYSIISTASGTETIAANPTTVSVGLTVIFPPTPPTSGPDPAKTVALSVGSTTPNAPASLGLIYIICNVGLYPPRPD